MKTRVLIAMLYFLPFYLFASDYQTEIDEFFALYSEGKIDESVDRIYSTNQYVSSIPDQIKNVKTQLAALEGLVGSMHFNKKLSEYVVSDLFVHVTYLVTYDRQPIRFEFEFFKVKSGWRVYSMSYDDDIDDDIEVLARDKALRTEK